MSANPLWTEYVEASLHEYLDDSALSEDPPDLPSLTAVDISNALEWTEYEVTCGRIDRDEYERFEAWVLDRGTKSESQLRANAAAHNLYDGYPS